MSDNVAANVLEDLAAMGIAASPHAFEIWHTHKSGLDPALSHAIADHQRTGQPLTSVVLEALYSTHILNGKTIRVAERSNRAVLMEIDGIVELIRISLGSSTSYSETLSMLLGDMVKTNDPVALKDIVSTLVHATKETQFLNRKLETGLKAAKIEVTELRKTLEDTRLEALKDALTGISNRRHFDQILQEAIDTCHHNRTSFALVMVDIDHFKHFNDVHGHLTGDKVLRVVAQSLREKFPKKVTVARFGGEEFAVIMPDADLMAGWVGAEAARQSIQARELVKRSTGEKMGRITVSLGVGVWRRTESSTSLISRADSALMQAKRNGRNRTVTEDQINLVAVA